MPEALTFRDARPRSQVEQDLNESFNTHKALGLPYARCKPREPELTLLEILRQLFDGTPAKEQSRRRRIKKQPRHRIQLDWSAIPKDYRVTREAIEALFYEVRPSPPEYGREERRLALSEVPFAERFGRQMREPWLLVAFSIRQPRKTRIICPLSARYVTISWLNNRLNSPTPLKRLPQLITNREAKQWVDTADLTQYDMSGFQSTSFERTGKDLK
jgi:hypothetical protein